MDGMAVATGREKADGGGSEEGRGGGDGGGSSGGHGPPYSTMRTTVYIAHPTLGAKGLLRELSPGPLAPEARIIPPDQAADAVWGSQ